MKEAGFPVTAKKLQDSIQCLMTELKRDNPFLDNRHGILELRLSAEK